MTKPNAVKRLRALPYDFQFRKKPVVTPQSLAAEYAELRTRTPNGRG